MGTKTCICICKCGCLLSVHKWPCGNLKFTRSDVRHHVNFFVYRHRDHDHQRLHTRTPHNTYKIAYTHCWRICEIEKKRGGRKQNWNQRWVLWMDVARCGVKPTQWKYLYMNSYIVNWFAFKLCGCDQQGNAFQGNCARYSKIHRRTRASRFERKKTNSNSRQSPPKKWTMIRHSYINRLPNVRQTFWPIEAKVLGHKHMKTV